VHAYTLIRHFILDESDDRREVRCAYFFRFVAIHKIIEQLRAGARYHRAMTEYLVKLKWKLSGIKWEKRYAAAARISELNLDDLNGVNNSGHRPRF